MLSATHFLEYHIYSLPKNLTSSWWKISATTMPYEHSQIFSQIWFTVIWYVHVAEHIVRILTDLRSDCGLPDLYLLCRLPWLFLKQYRLIEVRSVGHWGPGGGGAPVPEAPGTLLLWSGQHQPGAGERMKSLQSSHQTLNKIRSDLSDQYSKKTNWYSHCCIKLWRRHTQVYT